MDCRAVPLLYMSLFVRVFADIYLHYVVSTQIRHRHCPH